jgi:ribonuclease BN (tRNA processing enzyme)
MKRPTSLAGGASRNPTAAGRIRGVHRRVLLTALGSAALAPLRHARAPVLPAHPARHGRRPTPKATRSGPSQIIVIGDRGYVIDCGDGVARQMMIAGVFRTLRHVFITHHHSDHNADYGNLLLLAWGDV